MERGHKFDPAMVERLADSERLSELAPQRILEAAGLQAPPTSGTSDIRVIVDLGAGPGLIARGVSRLFPQATLYAFDVSPELVAYLSGQLSEEEHGRIRPRVSAESDVGLETDTVDFLFMIDVYHELEDAPALLAEARRVVRPGGTVLVVDWAQDGTSGGPPGEHRVPVAVLEREMREAGFAGVERSGVFTQHHAVRARVV